MKTNEIWRAFEKQPTTERIIDFDGYGGSNSYLNPKRVNITPSQLPFGSPADDAQFRRSFWGKVLSYFGF